MALAGLLILGVLVHLAENWRGKRAWEACKHELAAKGQVTDWSTLIPPSVPDDKNIFKAPKVTEWFVKSGKGKGFFAGIWGEMLEFNKKHHLRNPLAEITVVTSDTAVSPEAADLVLQYRDSVLTVAAGQQKTFKATTPLDFVTSEPFSPAIQQVVELVQCILGPSAKAPAGFGLLARTADQIKPARLVVRADKVLDTNAVIRLFPSNVLNSIKPYLGQWKVTQSGATSFNLISDPAWFYSAADYLEWSDSFQADFDLIREALKRPFARMEGDYERPAETPIPNFVAIRSAVQMLSQRAKCYLLLGQPDKALRELTLIRDLSRLLEGKPTGKPMTLVAAMINVAVTGLYAEAVAEGLRLQAWRDPQLIALQEQLKSVNLPPFVLSALQSEPAGICRVFERASLVESLRIFTNEAPSARDRFASALIPRGWIYQNLAVYARLHQRPLEMFDTKSGLIVPDKVTGVSQHLAQLRKSPYNILAKIAMPNYSKAAQTLARNQTLANQALIACALERHRLARGQYPETLDALVPQFLDQVPKDIIGGQPLHYHRTQDGSFLLYAIGWNQKDDGGTVAFDKSGKPDQAAGDWVWRKLEL